MTDETMMNPAELIKVEQLPVLTEQLHAIKDAWEQVVTECNAMECTVETTTAVKKRRAEINAAFKVLEDRRKEIKKAVMDPYTALEAVYKECVTEPHDRAETALVGKISTVEDALKSDCETRMRKYFDEIREREHVGDWLTWERGQFKIGLTEAKKKIPAQLMGQIADFVVRVSGDVKSIDTMENALEIMDEYKKCLNLALAIQTITARKERLAAEQEAARIRAEMARAERETVARVKQAAVLKPPTEAKQDPIRPEFPESFRLVMYFTRKEQWEAVKPLLKSLVEVVEKEGIRYE